MVAIYDEVDNEETNSRGTISDGAPFYKTMGSSYVDPRPVYGVGITSIAQPSFEYMVEKIEIGSSSSSLTISCRRRIRLAI